MVQVGKYGKRTGSVSSGEAKEYVPAPPGYKETRPAGSGAAVREGTVKRQSARKIPQNESERTPAERQYLADLYARRAATKRTTPVRSTKQAWVGYSPKLTSGVRRVVSRKGK